MALSAQAKAYLKNKYGDVNSQLMDTSSVDPLASWNKQWNELKKKQSAGVPIVQGGPVTVTPNLEFQQAQADIDAAIQAQQELLAATGNIAPVHSPAEVNLSTDTGNTDWSAAQEEELAKMRDELMNTGRIQREFIGTGIEYNPNVRQGTQTEEDLIAAYQEQLAKRNAASPNATSGFMPVDPTKQTVGTYAAESGLAGLVGSLEGSRNFVVDLAAENARNNMYELLASQNASGVDPTALIDAQRAAGISTQPKIDPNVLAAKIGQLRDTSASRAMQERLADYNVNPQSAVGIAGNVAAGVGGMLPAIGANLLVPGSGSAVMFSSAAGQATSEALAAGADYDEAFTYGVVSGATEIATEKILGGIPGLGKGWFDKKVAATAARMSTSPLGRYLVKIGAEALGEGFEEWLSEAIGQYTVRIYDEDERNRSVMDVATEGRDDRLYAALIGALTSLAMQAPTVNANNVAQYNAELTKIRGGIETALVEEGMTAQEAQQTAAAMVEQAQTEIATTTPAQTAQTEAQQTTDMLSAEMPQTGAQQPTQQQIEDELVSMATGEPIEASTKAAEVVNEQENLAVPTMRDILARINTGEVIPVSELLSRKEIQEAKRRADVSEEEKTINRYPIGANQTRDEKREEWAEILMKAGSARVANDGKIVYDGAVEQGRHADIIIGPPAAGKSSVFADPLSQEHKARIIDSDEAKKQISEFDHGYGANKVQEESAYIAEVLVLNKATSNGDNIVIPKVGKSPKSILEIAQILKARGYTVNLYLNSLPMDKAITRGIGRFIKEGRYVPIEYMLSVGNAPVDTYNAIKESGYFDYYEWKSNDVPYGQPPILREQGGNEYGTDYRKNGSAVGRGRGTQLGTGTSKTPWSRRSSTDQSTGINASDSTEAFSNAQKFAPNTVGAAQSNPNSYDALISKYGVLPEGEIPSRYAPVPKKTAPDQPVSLGARTFLESDIPNEFVQIMEDAVERGEFSRYVYTNEAATTEARRIIKENGYDGALKQWRRQIEKPQRLKNAPLKERLEAALGTSAKTDMALGIQLYKDAMAAKNYELAEQLVIEICALGTSLGQGVQAVSMLKRATPMGQLYYTTLMLDRMNTQLEAKYGSKFSNIKIDDSLKETLLASTTEQEIDDAMDAIKQNIADQVPTTWLDKWNAWRYLAMLGNAKTHIRNEFGNVIMGAATNLTSAVEAGIQNLAFEDGERTSAVLNRKQDAALIDFGNSDYDAMAAVVEGEAKYSNAALARDIEDRRTVFKTKWLEKARRLNSKLLEKEDEFFSRRQYALAMARFMKANNLTPEQLNANTPEANQLLNKARDQAIKKAQKATFKEANELANVLNRMKNSHKALDILLNGVVPFTKTPLNIARSGFSYSPVGLLRGLANLAPQINKGKYTATEVVEQISEGLVGSGVTLLGWLLYSLGALTGAPSDNEKERKAQERTGWQEYSLHIGDMYYSLDWLSPIAMPLFVGAEIGRISENEEMDMNQIVTALSQAANPLFEMSMLQGIIDVTSRVGYAGNTAQAAGEIVKSAATSYATQGVPTLFGQLARSIDKTRRETYVTGESEGVAREGKILWNKTKAKTPFASFTLEPYVDEWGRTEEANSTIGNTLEQFVSPGYTSKENRTAVDDFLDALYERTGETSVYPSTVDKRPSMNFDGEKKRLTAEQRTEYATVKGQTSYDLIDEFLDTNAYNRMNDSERAEILKDIYEYADYVARDSIGADWSGGKWATKMDGLSGLLEPIEYLEMQTLGDTNKNGSLSQGEVENYIDTYLASRSRTSKRKIWDTVTGGKEKNNPYR